jgi:hypothetical protein
MTSANAPKENFNTMYQTTLIGARIRSLMLGHYRYLDWERQLCDNAQKGFICEGASALTILLTLSSPMPLSFAPMFVADSCKTRATQGCNSC